MMFRKKRPHRAAVERGAKLLDIHKPGWQLTVNSRAIHSLDDHACVLGQLYGEYSLGLRALGLSPGMASTYYGFALPFPRDSAGEPLPEIPDSYYRPLDEEWLRAIEERLATPVPARL